MTRRATCSTKLVDHILCISPESVAFLDKKTKTPSASYPISSVRRWAAPGGSLTVDFGDAGGYGIVLRLSAARSPYSYTYTRNFSTYMAQQARFLLQRVHGTAGPLLATARVGVFPLRARVHMHVGRMVVLGTAFHCACCALMLCVDACVATT